jgi:uncharacterized membrane protein HdeD (DUF308 family)
MLNPVSSGPTIDKAMAEDLAKTWIIVLISGLVSFFAGIVILSIDWTVSDLAVFMSVLFILRGVFQLAMRPFDGSQRPYSWVAGLFSIFVGIAFVAWPDPTLLVLAIFIGAWIVVDGTLTLVGGIANRQEVKGWWIFAIFGVVELILGLALLRRPELTLSLAIAVAGIWAVVVGILQIIAAFELKHLPRAFDRKR